MTAPAYVSAGFHAANPTTAPTGTLGTTGAGDTILVFVTNGGSDSAPASLTGTSVSTGGLTWTKKTDLGGGASTDLNGSVWWARATGNHSGQTVIAATVNSGALGWMRVSGAPGTNDPLEVLSAVLNASGTNTAAGGTPSVNECKVILALFTDDDVVSSGYSATGVTLNERIDAISTGGVDTCVAVAEGNQATAAATGTVSWTNARGAGIYQIAIVLAVKPAIVAPTNLAAGSITDTTIPLTWTAPASGTPVSYDIDVDGTVTNTGSTATSYTVTGRTAGVPYRVKVAAVDSIGRGVYSSPIDVITTDSAYAVTEDDFTGTDGAGWDSGKWAAGQLMGNYNAGPQNTSTAVISSNRGRIDISGSEPSSIGFIKKTLAGDSLTAFRMLVSVSLSAYTIPTFVRIHFRHDAALTSTFFIPGGYFLQWRLEITDIALNKMTSAGSESTLGSSSWTPPPAAGEKAWLEVYASGTALKIRTWRAGVPRPAYGSGGTVEVTDATFSSGRVSIGGDAPVATDILFEDFRLWNLAAAPNSSLVIADAGHGHAADGVALTQVHTLAIADGAHAHAADGVALTQAHILAVADATHAQVADGVVLVKNSALVIADSTHAHVADGVALAQAHALAVADATHGQAADSITLTQAHVLAVADAAHAHAADQVPLVQNSALVVADATHAHAGDGVALTQIHGLVIAEGTHAHAVDALALTQVHTLVVADAAHAHAADAVTLTSGSALVIAEGTHAHAAGALALTQAHTLAVADASHAHQVDEVELDQSSTVLSLEVAHAFHDLVSDLVVLAQNSDLDVDDGQHGGGAGSGHGVTIVGQRTSYVTRPLVHVL